MKLDKLGYSEPNSWNTTAKCFACKASLVIEESDLFLSRYYEDYGLVEKGAARCSECGYKVVVHYVPDAVMKRIPSDRVDDRTKRESSCIGMLIVTVLVVLFFFSLWEFLQ